MKAKTHEETLQAVKDQEPPIEVGQHWRISDEDTVVLELRVLCRYPPEYPDGRKAEANGTGYLVMERCRGTQRHDERFALERLPEYNLRRLFEPVMS